MRVQISYAFARESLNIKVALLDLLLFLLEALMRFVSFPCGETIVYKTKDALRRLSLIIRGVEGIRTPE